MKRDNSWVILGSLPTPICILDQEGKILYANEGFLNFFECKEDEILLQTLEVLFAVSYREEVLKLVQEVFLLESKRVTKNVLTITKSKNSAEVVLSLSYYAEETPYCIVSIQEAKQNKILETKKFESFKRLVKEKIFLSRSVHLLLKDICQLFSEFLNLDLVWISRLKYGEKILLNGVYCKHSSFQKEYIFQTLLNRDSLSYHVNSKSLKVKEPIFIQSKTQEFSELKFLESDKKVFYSCYPIGFRTILIGTLNLYSLIEDFSFASSEEILEICSDLAYGIVFLENLQNLTLRTKSLHKITNIFTEVVSNFPNGAITVLDSDMVVLFAGGDSYSQFYGNPNSLIGQKWKDIFYQSIPTQNLENMKHGNKEFLKVSIQEKIFEIDLVPLFSEEKQTTGFIHIAKDITDLELAKQKAEEASKARQQFLANMSHEFRTPLNGIIGLTSLILETNLSSEQRKYVESIHASGEHLNLLLNEILDYSKIESGRLELEEYEVNLEVLVQDVISIVFSQVKMKRIELLYEIEEDVPEIIISDGERLRQILLNLVGNAIKFTDKGEVRILIKREEKLLENSLFPLLICIKDTGIGIEKTRIQKILEPFVQADSSIHTKYGGTGLGLPISLKLTKALGGDLQIDSEPGRGSVFSIFLPVKFKQAKKVLEDSVKEPILIFNEDKSYSLYELRELKKFCTQVELETNKNNYLNAINRFSGKLLILHHYTTEPLSFYIHLIEAAYYYKNLKVIFITHESNEYEYFQKLSPSSFTLLEKPITLSELRKTIKRTFNIEKENTKDLHLDKNLAKQYPLSILVAEDNPINQYMIKTCLGAMGYRPDIAGNGLEALRMANEKTYDIIFMDMYMPEMDGITASKKIMDDIHISKKPVIIAVTANVYEADKELCFSVGMKDFVAKPIQIYEFQEKIIKWAKEILKMEKGSQNEFYELIDETIIKELDTIPDPTGNRLFVNLFQLFLKNSPETINQLKAALVNKNVEDIKQQSHKLKGMSSNIGGKKLSSLFKDIELNASNFAYIESKWEELLQVYEKTKEYLNWVAAHKPNEFP